MHPYTGDDAARPHILLVTGPPGAGKSTLAVRLAETLHCPCVSRDVIREGMHRTLSRQRGAAAQLDHAQVNAAFAGAVEQLTSAGVSLVAEAAFQRPLWRALFPDLERNAQLRIVECAIPNALVQRRIDARMRESAWRAEVHDDVALLTELRAGARSFEHFDWFDLDVPRLRADTSDGYAPAFEDIVAFARGELSQRERPAVGLGIR